MSVARDFARFLIETEADALPEASRRHAAMLVASTLASAALGYDIESARIIRGLAREDGGHAHARVWFDPGPALPVATVARVNAVTSDASASDDSDLRNIMHCGTPLVSTALAIAEREGSSGRDVLAAIVLGYEAAGRMSEAVPGWRGKGFHGSTLTIFAATVAAGRLLGLDVEAMTHALSLAATSTGSLTKAAWTSVAREYHAGQSVVNGVWAAQSAARGYTSEELIFEGAGGFFAVFGGAETEAASNALLTDLGERWDIDRHMAIKLVPGGHPSHALAEAAANAARAGNLAPDEIETIVVSQPGMTRLPEPVHPVDLVDMAHSPAYFVAAGAADRGFGWAHAGLAKIADPVIHRLIDRIEIAPEPVEHRERYRQGATVTLRTTDARAFTSTVYEPAGSAHLGLRWEDVEAKFVALVPHAGLDRARIDESFAAIRGLGELGSVAPILDPLRPAPRR